MNHSGPLGSDGADHEWEERRGKACGVCRGQRGPGTWLCPYTQLLSLGSLPWAEGHGEMLPGHALLCALRPWCSVLCHCTSLLCWCLPADWAVRAGCGRGAQLPVGEGLSYLSCPGLLPFLANYTLLLAVHGETVKLLRRSLPAFLNGPFL